MIECKFDVLSLNTAGIGDSFNPIGTGHFLRACKSEGGCCFPLALVKFAPDNLDQ